MIHSWWSWAMPIVNLLNCRRASDGVDFLLELSSIWVEYKVTRHAFTLEHIPHQTLSQVFDWIWNQNILFSTEKVCGDEMSRSKMKNLNYTVWYSVMTDELHKPTSQHSTNLQWLHTPCLLVMMTIHSHLNHVNWQYTMKWNVFHLCVGFDKIMYCITV